MKIKIGLKLSAGILGLFGIGFGIYGLLYEPALQWADRPPFPSWIKWAGLIVASGAIIAHFLVDIMEILGYKEESAK